MNICKCQECPLISKKQYSNYCWKHRKSHLLINGMININCFTCIEKDYTKPEIIKFYWHNLKKPKERKTKLDKTKCFQSIQRYHLFINSSKEDKLKRIQSSFRNYLIRRKVKNHGIGILDRNLCNNNEDFYTYENTEDIETKYFYSYIDKNKKIWAFDIRSLYKLINMNYDNPYTTEKIPENIKKDIIKFIHKLEVSNQSIIINDSIIQDRESIIKQKYVDFF